MRSFHAVFDLHRFISAQDMERLQHLIGDKADEVEVGRFGAHQAEVGKMEKRIGSATIKNATTENETVGNATIGNFLRWLFYSWWSAERRSSHQLYIEGF